MKQANIGFIAPSSPHEFSPEFLDWLELEKRLARLRQKRLVQGACLLLAGTGLFLLKIGWLEQFIQTIATANP